MEEPTFVQVQDLHKSFGANHVLRGVNLAVGRAESLVILGGSGAGKSVFLSHLIGLMQADRGSVTIDGQNWAELDRGQTYDLRTRFGMSFQEGALFDSMTVYDNIAFPLRRQTSKMGKGEIKDRVAECLETVGMPGIAQLMPSELSGGMRRRVGFARAIALKPEILLFDEPTTGLDPIMTTVLGEVIIQMRERLQATTITITHDISSAKMIANRVAMMFKGELVHQAPRDAFFNCDDPIVRQFVDGKSQGPATEALIKR
ncbi:ABC transporter ATP-binding protein [Acanthopleuribacter pedis]|uniref:ABC transporter ATP-binding protein n=1 Tax=Acanthopleuribacter pedis TaxID=442870 RepID=A0A8J7U701_9BACT|nr:ABC transporter ATP-binding protein [Acanthopleuribacter pedis]MBO1321973.1 ABC transporter ATP-binding protein [Acanthopleuribacter pedis]